MGKGFPPDGAGHTTAQELDEPGLPESGRCLPGDSEGKKESHPPQTIETARDDVVVQGHLEQERLGETKEGSQGEDDQTREYEETLP